jgi:hypothetical protein
MLYNSMFKVLHVQPKGTPARLTGSIALLAGLQLTKSCRNLSHIVLPMLLGGRLAACDMHLKAAMASQPHQPVDNVAQPSTMR